MFIPGNRGKISVFAPFPFNFAHISFKNDGLIPIVAGTWLTIWLFIVTLGWSCAVRQEPFVYKKDTQGIQSYKRNCKASGNFMDWFNKEYLPLMKSKEKEAMENRKFLMFQAPLYATFDQFVSGLFTAFTLAIVSDRELLIDYPEEYKDIFLSPGWEVNAKHVWPSIPLTHTIIDLCTPPSFIVPPSHKWMWADILMRNVSVLLSTKQLVIVESDEFFGPLIWANPLYRDKLCNVCNVEEAYGNFGKLFLKFSKSIIKEADDVMSSIGKNFSIAVTDARIVQGKRLKQVLDTTLRCMSSFSSDDASFLFLPMGRGVYYYPPWKTIGSHKTFNYFETSNKKLDYYHQHAVLYALANKAEAVLTFQGSHLGESLAYSNDKPLYSVFQRIPFCGEVAIRLPCIDKFVSIVGSKGINMSLFMTSELSNQMKCNI